MSIVREIKFRAWDTLSEIMFINEEIRTEAFVVYSLKDEEWFYVESEDIILMQYTGIKDKNDVEIYEGDIVKKPKVEALGQIFPETKYEIEFFEGLYHIKSHNFMRPLDRDCIFGLELEVIGNIYENPELLESK